jgi:hypothetical protein
MSTVPLLADDDLVTLIQNPSTASHAWADHAACAGLPGDPYFPEKDGLPPAEAISLCASCPVARQCLASALVYEAADGLRHGWWGGYSPGQRAALWPRLRNQAVELPVLALTDPASIARRLRANRWTVKAIAAELGCAERTVYRYLTETAA